MTNVLWNTREQKLSRQRLWTKWASCFVHYWSQITGEHIWIAHIGPIKGLAVTRMAFRRRLRRLGTNRRELVCVRLQVHHVTDTISCCHVTNCVKHKCFSNRGSQEVLQTSPWCDCIQVCYYGNNKCSGSINSCCVFPHLSAAQFKL